MSLLQISEPDEINSKPKLKCVVGIDLGTTNSLIGSLVDGKVIFFPDEDGNLLIPSVVNYSSQNSCRVGFKCPNWENESFINYHFISKTFDRKGNR